MPFTKIESLKITVSDSEYRSDVARSYVYVKAALSTLQKNYALFDNGLTVQGFNDKEFNGLKQGLGEHEKIMIYLTAASIESFTLSAPKNNLQFRLDFS